MSECGQRGSFNGACWEGRDIDHRTRGAMVRERDAIESKLLLAKTFGVRSLDATPVFPRQSRQRLLTCQDLLTDPYSIPPRGEGE
jgi:hypothetical protein